MICILQELVSKIKQMLLIHVRDKTDRRVLNSKWKLRNMTYCQAALGKTTYNIRWKYCCTPLINIPCQHNINKNSVILTVIIDTSWILFKNQPPNRKWFQWINIKKKSWIFYKGCVLVCSKAGSHAKILYIYIYIYMLRNLMGTLSLCTTN